MTGRGTLFITGASSGIGPAIARGAVARAALFALTRPERETVQEITVMPTA